MAAALESGSSHPLTVAILAKAKEAKAPVPPAFGAKALAGKGISGNVGGVEVLLASPSAAAETADIPADLTARIEAFNDGGKTISVLLANSQVAGLLRSGTRLARMPSPD